MPGENQDGSQIVSVRLPHELIRRLDRYLDWSAFYRRVKSSRNAAIREALGNWLDDQEQLAGFLEPQAQRQQFQAAYQSLSPRHTWVPIYRLRQLLPWPRERFDAVLEGLRADHHVELDSAAPAEMSDQAIQDSYHVHGQLYARLRWCGSSGRLPSLFPKRRLQ
jgi:Arc/MetJ-type ribon-helix-helix transcriptional regulator